MWSVPTRNPQFIVKVPERLEEPPGKYGTVARMGY